MATPWTIPRAWEGRTVAVLATGASLTRNHCDAAVRAYPTMAINNAFELAPNADILYACDAKFWHHYTDALRFQGIKVTLDDQLPYKSVMLLKNLGRSGFFPDPSGLHAGLNSGFQALQLAVKMGAQRVLLLGFDMHGDHFFGSHPAHLQDADPNVFDRFRAEFEKVAPVYARLGVDIVNCTQGSALKCFRFSTLENEMSNTPKKADVPADDADPVDVGETAPEASEQESNMDRIDRILRLQHGHG